MTGAQPGEARQAAADWFARLRAPDGENDRAAFEVWRDADPANAAAYERLEHQWSDAALLGLTRTGQARSLGNLTPRAVRPATRFAIAAILVAALCATLLFVGHDRLGLFAPGPVTETAGDAIRTVALADGSSLMLDTGSAARIELSSVERRVTLLRGRARFTVAHDTRRPFRAIAGPTIVTARGTIFDVALTATAARVLLLRGAVDVESIQDTAHRVVRLTPGETVSVERGAAMSPKTIAAPNAATWAVPMLSFDDAPLSEVVALANRHAAVRLRLSDPAIGPLRVTGAYRAGDTAGLARSLAASLGLEVVDLGRELLLQPAGPHRSSTSEK